MEPRRRRILRALALLLGAVTLLSGILVYRDGRCGRRVLAERMINHGTDSFEVTRQMRIAQMIIKPVPRAVWQEVEKLPETQRGAGGFGHTGH